MGEGGFWWRLVHLEPALVRGLVMAVVLLLGSLGIVVIPGLPDGLIGVWLAVGAIVQALWTRGAVTANAKVAVRVPDPVEAPGVVEPGDATTTASGTAILHAARTGTSSSPAVR